MILYLAIRNNYSDRSNKTVLLGAFQSLEAAEARVGRAVMSDPTPLDYAVHEIELHDDESDDTFMELD